MKLYVKLILACMIFTWGLAVPLTVYGQSITLRHKISFSANNVTVADALDKLSRKVGLTFSYNPDQIHSERIVKVDMKNRMLLEVLDHILGPSQFGFRLTGNQVIIFRNKPSTLSGLSAKPINQQTDTVFIPVSTAVHDTLILLDTIQKVDTIKIEVINHYPVREPDSLHSDTGSNKVTYNIGVSISTMFTDGNFRSSDRFNSKLNEYREHYSGMMFSGSLGVEASATFRAYIISAGLSFTSFAQKLDYEYVISEGGYYRKDTLDPYYTVTGTDTTWFYLIDSTYIPVDSRAFNYHINNHTRYLELPITVGYQFYLKKIQLLVRAGLIPGIFISSEGFTINPEEQGATPLRDIKSKNLVMSYLLSAGLNIPLEKNLTLKTSIFFRSHLNSIYNGFPIMTRYSAFGINATLVYKISGLEK